MSSIWEKVQITTDKGDKVNAVAPVVITASRSTDVPAFYSEWFLNRLKKRYAKWINPYNKKPMFVSFNKTRLIVFWTKNADPILKCLDEIDKLGYLYYFQYTLNDYESEGFEKGLPPLKERIDTFKRLSVMIGKDKVIWRFDPVLLTNDMNIDDLISKIKRIGDSIHNHTEKLVFSFADIESYKKVRNNLRSFDVDYAKVSKNMMESVSKGIQELNKDWGLDIATCAEEVDLSKFGIGHNKCIDDELIKRVFHFDKDLIQFVVVGKGYSYTNKKAKSLKDKGQRKHCGCIYSKDIGQYDTCGHLCLYCYANSSPKRAFDNMQKHDINSDSILAV